MDAILFSAKPKMVNVDDAIRHLSSHKELYWEVGFKIARKFSFPIRGYIHISGRKVEYEATIKNIIPFSQSHFEDENLKPAVWRNLENIRSHPWKHALVITRIVPFPYKRYRFKKCDGSAVCHPPQNYINVRPLT
jgi:hypothetical protein